MLQLCSKSQSGPSVKSQGVDCLGTLATLLKSAPSSDNLLAMDTSILCRCAEERRGERAPLAAVTQEGEVVRLVMQLLAPSPSLPNSPCPPTRRRCANLYGSDPSCRIFMNAPLPNMQKFHPQDNILVVGRQVHVKQTCTHECRGIVSPGSFQVSERQESTFAQPQRDDFLGRGWRPLTSP